MRNAVIGNFYTDKNDYDKTKDYGKQKFAEYLVTPIASTIDLNGLFALLTNISEIIREHAERFTNKF